MILETVGLKEIVARHAIREGRTESGYPGLYFYRANAETSFVKRHSFGVTLTVVVQGAKVARFRDCELRYDSDHMLLVNGQAEFEAAVVSADDNSPYLAVAYEFPEMSMREAADTIAERVPNTPLLEGTSSVPLAEAGHGIEPLTGSVPDLAKLSVTCENACLLSDRKLAATFERVLRALEDPDERRLILPLYLEELALRVLSSQAGSFAVEAYKRDGDWDRIQDAMRYVHKNLSRPLTVEMIADSVQMSPSHLAHRFSRIAKVSPMAYHKRLRLMDARRRLSSAVTRVGEVAEAIGYESLSHFVRDFKAFFGASPREYQRRIGQ